MSEHDPEQRRIETTQFRGWLADAAKSPEPQRSDFMARCLRMLTICPYVTQDECFETVYGVDGAQAFWEVQCSEPIKISVFVNLLALTDSKNKSPVTSEALWVAMLAAFQAGEKWFVGDTTPLEVAKYGRQVPTAEGVGRLKVHARQAAGWLLDMPKRRHLVPEWLAKVHRPEPQGGIVPVAAPIEGAAAEPQSAAQAPTTDQPPASPELIVEDRPQQGPQTVAPTVTYYSGTPGRPTSVHLVEIEMERRAESREMITDSLLQEANALVGWLRKEHTQAPRLTAKTIQNTLGAKWRTLGGVSRKEYPEKK